MNEERKIPKRVFIVPYRNRTQHKFFFSKYMSFIAMTMKYISRISVTQERLTEVPREILGFWQLKTNTLSITKI